MTGKFITLEGIEGSGKSTSLTDITKILDKHSISYITTKEPGGSALGTELRSLLLNKNSNITSEVELLLMMADRKDHVDNLILPNLENGVWVLSDRYLDSTYAYQGGGRQIETSTIDKLADILNLPKPDLTILYDLPPDVALQRAAQRSSLDRFESEPIEFHTRIRKAYLERAKREKERFKIINSSTDFDGVKEQVLKIITKFLDE